MHPVLYLATQNKHKVEELSSLLQNHFTVRDLSTLKLTEEIPETGSTLAENSLQKAQYIAEKYQVTCLADDSGLEVDSLGGAPGVYSARYAGEPKNDQANLKLLLQNLQGKDARNARFVTVLTYHHQGVYHQFEGEIKGGVIKVLDMILFFSLKRKTEPSLKCPCQKRIKSPTGRVLWRNSKSS